MKTFIKLSLLAVLAGFLFNGCRKDVTQNTAANQSSNKFTASSTSIPDGMVMTPQGLMSKSNVHEIPAGYHLEIRGNHVLTIKTSTGELKEDLGVITFPSAVQTPAINPQKSPASPSASGSRNLAVTQTNGSGWVTYSEWGSTTGPPIGTFSTKWALPATPANHTEIIYIGNGVSAAKYSPSGSPLVIQPILEWGNNGITGNDDTHWTASSWCCWNGNAAYTTPVTVTSANSPFQGVITLTAQQTGGSYNYTCAFTGITNTTLTVVASTTNTAGNNVVYPSNIPILNWAYETLQSYNMSAVTDYPAQNSVNMTNVSLETGLPGSFTYPSSLSWTGVTATAAQYGEHTNIISTSSSAGEVDLWFHYAAPSISYSPQTIVWSSCTTTTLTPVNTGGKATSWSISPTTLTANTGLTFNSSTGVITGPPTKATSPTNYTITATNNGGTSSFVENISTTLGGSISYPSSVVLDQNVLMTPISPTVTGTPPTSYSISPALPSNLIFNTSTGVISGTPLNPQAPTTYTITGTRGSCISTATISIAVYFAFTVKNTSSINLSITFNDANGDQVAGGVVNSGTNTVYYIPQGVYSRIITNNAGQPGQVFKELFETQGPDQFGITFGYTFTNVTLSPSNDELDVEND